MSANPTLEKALRLIAHARSLSDRYEGRKHEMPAEVVEQIRKCNAEAVRLKSIVEAEEQAKSLESWASDPAPDADLKGMDLARVADEPVRGLDAGSPHYLEAQKNLAIERFAKGLRHGFGTLGAEEKADLVEDATGELIVPHALAGPIFKELPRLGTLRGLSLQRTINSNKLDVRSLTEGSVGWLKLETNTTNVAIPDATPAPARDTIEVHDLVGLVKIGRDELEDTDANLVALVQELVARQFAEAEDDAFAAGSGTGQPFGVATSSQITQTVTAATEATPTADELRKLIYQVPAQFQRGGVYVAHADVTEAVATMKDGDGNYLWQPSLSAGEPDRLFGKPWHTVEGMPGMGAAGDTTVDERSVVFGDFRQGYAVVNRRGITVQRLEEKYAEEGKVGFLFTQRVGGDVIRPKAFAAYLL